MWFGDVVRGGIARLARRHATAWRVDVRILHGKFVDTYLRRYVLDQ